MAGKASYGNTYGPKRKYLRSLFEYGGRLSATKKERIGRRHFTIRGRCV